MLGAKPESMEFAEQLMCLSGGLAVANGLFAWLTTRATVNWLAVELGVGVLWLGMTIAIRTGRPLARIAATVLSVISMPVIGIMILVASLFGGNWPDVIVMFVDVIRLPLALAIVALLWTPGSRRYLRYVGAGGQVEPRPLWTLGRRSHGTSLPKAEGPVSDEEVGLLRDYLQAGGQA